MWRENLRGEEDGDSQLSSLGDDMLPALSVRCRLPPRVLLGTGGASGGDGTCNQAAMILAGADSMRGASESSLSQPRACLSISPRRQAS